MSNLAVSKVAEPAVKLEIKFQINDHKDYHTWSNDEVRAYQHYQTEHHEKRAFGQLSSREQEVYWNWRHDHPDDSLNDQRRKDNR